MHSTCSLVLSLAVLVGCGAQSITITETKYTDSRCTVRKLECADDNEVDGECPDLPAFYVPAKSTDYVIGACVGNEMDDELCHGDLGMDADENRVVDADGNPVDIDDCGGCTYEPAICASACLESFTFRCRSIDFCVLIAARGPFQIRTISSCAAARI